MHHYFSGKMNNNIIFQISLPEFLAARMISVTNLITTSPSKFSMKVLTKTWKKILHMKVLVDEMIFLTGIIILLLFISRLLEIAYDMF